MRIMILGANGYLGWPTAMYLAGKGHDVHCVDSLVKQEWAEPVGGTPLEGWPQFRERMENSAGNITGTIQDIIYGDFSKNIREWKPDAIIHYAEQPSAPYSMISAKTCNQTNLNNIRGTLNLLWAIKDTDIHLVKLGTMGEYGTPNIDIEEGWLDVEHNGRRDRVLYPKKPGSFYHAAKVSESTFIEFACRAWGIRATDLNQGVVYGTYGGQTVFHYDAIFGTALNRFVAQAAANMPLTIYGNGSQTRGWLNIADTLQCVELACLNPARGGEFRVFNQFTEQFSVQDLAELVREGTDCEIVNIDNPRVEDEDHYYNAKHTGLSDLGLKPHLLTETVVMDMWDWVWERRELLNTDVLEPTVRWR